MLQKGIWCAYRDRQDHIWFGWSSVGVPPFYFNYKLHLFTIASSIFKNMFDNKLRGLICKLNCKETDPIFTSALVCGS